MQALHELGRRLEALAEIEHACAARRDGDHYAELQKQFRQAMRDAEALQQRADRHLRQIAATMKGANDND